VERISHSRMNADQATGFERLCAAFFIAQDAKAGAALTWLMECTARHMAVLGDEPRLCGCYSADSVVSLLHAHLPGLFRPAASETPMPAPKLAFTYSVPIWQHMESIRSRVRREAHLCSQRVKVAAVAAAVKECEQLIGADGSAAGSGAPATADVASRPPLASVFLAARGHCGRTCALLRQIVETHEPGLASACYASLPQAPAGVAGSSSRAKRSTSFPAPRDALISPALAGSRLAPFLAGLSVLLETRLRVSAAEANAAACQTAVAMASARPVAASAAAALPENTGAGVGSTAPGAAEKPCSPVSSRSICWLLEDEVIAEAAGPLTPEEALRHSEWPSQAASDGTQGLSGGGDTTALPSDRTAAADAVASPGACDRIRDLVFFLVLALGIQPCTLVQATATAGANSDACGMASRSPTGSEAGVSAGAGAIATPPAGVAPLVPPKPAAAARGAVRLWTLGAAAPSLSADPAAAQALDVTCLTLLLTAPLPRPSHTLSHNASGPVPAHARPAQSRPAAGLGSLAPQAHAWGPPAHSAYLPCGQLPLRTLSRVLLARAQTGPLSTGCAAGSDMPSPQYLALPLDALPAWWRWWYLHPQTAVPGHVDTEGLVAPSPAAAAAAHWSNMAFGGPAGAAVGAVEPGAAWMQLLCGGSGSLAAAHRSSGVAAAGDACVAVEVNSPAAGADAAPLSADREPSLAALLLAARARQTAYTPLQLGELCCLPALQLIGPALQSRLLVGVGTLDSTMLPTGIARSAAENGSVAAPAWPPALYAPALAASEQKTLQVLVRVYRCGDTHSQLLDLARRLALPSSTPIVGLADESEQFDGSALRVTQAASLCAPGLVLIGPAVTDTGAAISGADVPAACLGVAAGGLASGLESPVGTPPLHTLLPPAGVTRLAHYGSSPSIRDTCTSRELGGCDYASALAVGTSSGVAAAPAAVVLHIGDVAPAHTLRPILAVTAVERCAASASRRTESARADGGGTRSLWRCVFL